MPLNQWGPVNQWGGGTGVSQDVVLLAAVQTETTASLDVYQTQFYALTQSVQSEFAQSLPIALTSFVTSLDAVQREVSTVINIQQQQTLGPIAATQAERGVLLELDTSQSIFTIDAVQSELASQINIVQIDGQQITLSDAVQSETVQRILLPQNSAVESVAGLQQEVVLTVGLSQSIDLNMSVATQFENAQIMTVIQSSSTIRLDNLILVPVENIYSLELINQQTYTLEEI